MGDDFLRTAVGEFYDLYEKSLIPKSETTTPYLFEFYNVHHFEKLAAENGIHSAMAHMLNALMEAANTCKRLPRFLVIMMDTDLLADFELHHDSRVDKDFTWVLTWFTKQVQILIKRKRLALTEKKPGVVFGEHPVVIYVKTLRRPIYYPPSSKIGKICSVRARFNEALNDAVAQIGHHIMNITNCSELEHFDASGRLSKTGKSSLLAAVWSSSWEIW